MFGPVCCLWFCLVGLEWYCDHLSGEKGVGVGIRWFVK